MRRLDRRLLVIVAIAGSVRLAFFVLYLRSPLSGFYAIDNEYYRNWATRLARGDWLGTGVFEKAPLYPYLLGVVYRIFGAADELALVLQLLLGVLTCMLVYWCGRRLFDPATAFVAGLLAAVYGPFVFYECMVMKSFLSPLLTMTALYCGLRYSNGASFVWAALSGAAVGLACLVRENHVLLLLPLGLWVWDSSRTAVRPSTRRARALASLVVSFALVLLPSAIRNLVVSGETVVVTSGGGEVLYMAYGPTASAYYAAPEFVAAEAHREHEDFRREARRRTGKELTPAQSSRYWMHETIREVLARPGRAVKLAVAKAIVLFNDFEVPDNQYYAVTRRHVPLLYGLPTFGWLVGMGLLGIVVCLGSMRRYQLPLGFVAAHVLSVVLVYNFGRFRIGLMPVWILFSAHGLVWFVRAWRPGTWPGLWRPGVATVVVVLVTVSAFLPAPGSSRKQFDAQREYRLGLLALRGGDLPAAGQHLKSALQRAKVPSSLARIHAALAQVLFDAGEPQDAREHYERALELDPAFDGAHVNLGMLLAKQGQTDTAIEHYEEAIRINPRNADAWYNLGVVLAGRDVYDDAIAKYTEAIRIRPHYTDAYLGRADVLLKLRRHEEAVQDCLQALRLRPEFDHAHYLLGLAYEQAGSANLAVDEYERAIRANPSFSPALAQLGGMRIRQGEYLDAIKLCREAVRLDPKHVDALLNLGAAYAQFGMQPHTSGVLRKSYLEKAIQSFRQAQHVDPKNPKAYYNLGILLAQIGRTTEAIEQLRQAVTVDANMAEGHCRLGTLLDSAGDSEEAIASYQAALKISPHMPEASFRLAWLLATHPDENLRDGKEAVAVASRATELKVESPWRPQILDALAAAHAEIGEFDEAVRVADQAIKEATQMGNTRLLSQIKRRRSLYQAGRPYHAPRP